MEKNEMNIPAQEETVTPVFVDSIKVTQYEDQFVVERVNEEGTVTGSDPIADMTMLDVLEKAIKLINEQILRLRTRNASYEGHMMAIQDLQRQQAEAMATAAAEVQMPE